ncbi:Probable inactive dehydrogenase [Sparassis crispa]|uniref:Probable inactive dehydrogenase n=1 Tax=Sparassis crispa TaxID=139825 RepID=A0A401GSR3_9APHY|nr:Probable inactive dehydrogenase [Sparassis crispa]GBE84784.1 Probable inactive dehydrogenase [Sparassis crispa]
MSSEPAPKLFQPIKVGDMTLAHRVVLAPLTRFRADAAHVHGDLAVEYYTQRASVPGTLLITEATFISANAGGFAHVPGMWNEAQVAAWKRVTDAVHAKGSYIYVQLWALGRAADSEELQKEDTSFEYVAASDIQLTGKPTAPRPLTEEEIKEYIQAYGTAASNAVHGAGFDGVEVHGANGYLPDQFLQDVSNNRTDKYGDSIENRARFLFEILAAVTAKIGAKKTGLRLSPWSEIQDMRMEDPVPTFTYVVSRIAELYPDLAYIHFVEPWVSGTTDRTVREGETNDYFRKIWAPRPVISAGGYTREHALDAADKKGDLIAFGRAYISNPDLPLRLRRNIPLVQYHRSTVYIPEAPKGYIDYPFADAAAL